MSTQKQTVWQFLKFTLFSVSAGLLQIAVFALLKECLHPQGESGLAYWLCYLPALILSVLYNFTVNRQYTFRSAANVPVAMLKVAGFYAVFTPLSTWGGQVLATAGVNEYIVLAATMVSNFVLEYLFCRLVVYRGTIDTNRRAIDKQTTSVSEDGADR